MFMKFGKVGAMVVSVAVSVVVTALVFGALTYFAYAATGDGSGDNSSKARMSITPASGKAPLAVKATIYAESQLLCTSFALDWGDGSPAESYDPGQYTKNCYGGKFKRDFTHTYATTTATSTATTTVYKVRAKAGPTELKNLNTMTLLVTIYGDDWAPDSGNTTNQDSTCFVNPNSGSEPFVTAAYIPLGGKLCDGKYKYYVDWGDGFGSENRLCDNKAIHYDIFYHKYATSGNYTAKIMRSHDDDVIDGETCAVTVDKAAELKLIKPSWHETAVIDRPFNIKWSLKNIPPKRNGIEPKLRLTFVTEKGLAGFIADVDTKTTSYEWRPTTRPCLEGACQSSISKGKYYIQASLIYDICNGDPYCGKPVPVIASDKSADMITVTDVGIPVESWLYTVHDRLFAFPVVSSAPATVNFTTVLNSNASCNGGSYVIEYGDGTSSSQAYPSGKCEAFASSFTHGYTKPGIYRVLLYKNGLRMANLDITVTKPVTMAKLNLGNVASAWVAFTNLLVKWLSF